MKIGICGHFNLGNDPIGGQTIRTRIIKKELEEYYGRQHIETVDTEGWKMNPLSLFIKCVKMAKHCTDIIILPAHNGIKVFIPFFILLTRLFRYDLHYIVIGGWLRQDLDQNKWLIPFVKKIDYIYVQTETLKKSLEKISIKEGVYILPNFKPVEPIVTRETREEKVNDVIKVCTLSRVNEKKGITDAINAISEINLEGSLRKIVLDVYGPVEDSYEFEFKELLMDNEEFVSYKGIIDYKECVTTLKGYDLLLFPTKYFTEGFPGTIIDSYLAGVPVVASRWESYDDIIIEYETGITFQFNNYADFKNKLKLLISNESLIMKMKKNCIIESQKYTSQNAMKVLIDRIENKVF